MSYPRTSARSGFTLIELVAVIVVLGILSAVALPRFFDHSAEARRSADKGSLAGVKTAMLLAFVDHRENQTPASGWIDEVTDLPAIMETGQLPSGITIVGSEIQDQRGNRYALVPETMANPARFTLTFIGPGGSL